MNIHYNNIHSAVKYRWGGHGRLTGTWGVELSGMGGGGPWGTRGNTGIELSGIGGKAHTLSSCRKEAKQGAHSFNLPKGSKAHQ